MRTPKAHISVFTRLPSPGSSKTRLVPALGAEGAADVQREMSEHVVRQARILSATDGAVVEARVTGGSPAAGRRWLGVRTRPQGEGDLGERLARALTAGLRQAEVAAVIGGDCPTVDAADMRAVLHAAEERGAAIVPAFDGGFCLLALSRATAGSLPGALAAAEWGSRSVAMQTIAALAEAGVTCAVLDARADVDLPEDLPAWFALRSAWRDRPTSLAVVIPTLNEEERLPRLLDILARERAEVVVVDGGSLDRTESIAREAGVLLIAGSRGRAAQMNAGAEAVSADALLFLHADTEPPQGFAQTVLDVLGDPEVLVGSFRFSLGATSPGLRLVEWGTNVRARRWALPYGDQGLFMRRVAWRALGGFPDIPVMEDYQLVRAARTAGRVQIANAAATTSDRRWREVGTWRYSALNAATVLRHRLGTSPVELAEWRARYSKR